MFWVVEHVPGVRTTEDVPGIRAGALTCQSPRRSHDQNMFASEGSVTSGVASEGSVTSGVTSGVRDMYIA